MHPLFLPSCPSFVVLSFLSFPSSVSFEVALPVQCPPVRGSCSQAGKQGVCQTQCCLHQGRQHDAEANFHLQSWEMLNRVEGFMAWKPGPASPASSKQRRASRRLTTLSRIGASAKWPGIFFFSTIKRLSKLRQHFSHVGFPFSITSLALVPSNHTPDPKLHNSRCFRRTHCSDTSTLKKAEVPAWSTTKLTWEFTCKVCLRVFPRRSRCFTRRIYYILQSFELRKVQISHSIQLLMCEGLFSLDDFAGWIFLWRCLHWLGRLNVSEANAFNIVLLVVFLDQCIETWDFLITLLELFEKLFFHLQGSHMVATLWLWSFQGLFLASCYPQWCCSTHWQRVRNQEMDQWNLILHGTSHMSLSWFFAATVHLSCLCLQGRWCHTRSLVQAGPQKFWDGVFSKISTVNYHHHLWYPIMYSNHHSCWIIRVGCRSF